MIRFKKEKSSDASEKQTAKKEKKNPKTLALSVLKYFLICAIVLMLCFSIFFGLDSFSLASVKNWVQTNLLGYNSGDGFPVTYDGESVDFMNFSSENDSPAVISNTSFMFISDGGRVLALRQHTFSSPTMKRCGNNFLLFDLGNKSYCTVTNGTTFSDTMKSSHTIYGGTIASNGNYAISSDSNGYSSQVTIYDSLHQQLFKWSSQLYRINTIAFNSDGTKFIAGGFAAENGSLKSIIQVFSIYSAEPIATFYVSDNLLLDVSFADNDRIIAVGDQACFIGNLSDSSIITYEYPSALLSYSIDPQRGIALCLSASGDNRRSDVYYLDLLGQETHIVHYDSTVKSLDFSEKGILILSETTAQLYDLSANLVSSAEIGIDSIRAIACDNANGIYVLSHSGVRYEELVGN